MKTIFKEAAVAATITFDQADNEIELVSPHHIKTFIDIISLNGLGGSPVVPGAGSYTIRVRTEKDGGWKTVADNGTIAATATGGSALADGVQLGASYLGSIVGVKVVPTGITAATHYRVVVKQFTGS